jgi:hypothetical protein
MPAENGPVPLPPINSFITLIFQTGLSEFTGLNSALPRLNPENPVKLRPLS